MPDNQGNLPIKQHVLSNTAPAFFKNIAHQKLRRVPKEEELTIKLVVKHNEMEFDPVKFWSMSREDRRQAFREKYSIKEEHVNILEDFAKKYGLKLKRVNHHLGKVTLAGKVHVLEKIFGVSLNYFQHDSQVSSITHDENEYMGHVEDIKIPKELVEIVDHVLGLSHSPMQHNTESGADPLHLGNFQAAAYGVTSDYFAEQYNFPAGYLGKGQKIAIISCGGGYTDSGFDAYFKKAGIAKPQMNWKSVGSCKNNPGGSWMYDYEMATDILVAACSAPEASFIIYFTKNSIQGFSDAVQAVMEEDDGPMVISYSWGSSENGIAAGTAKGVNRVLEYATLVSQITILCSSGDKGANNNYNYSDSTKIPTEPMIQFPASSPWVTSCGGTMYNIKTDGAGDEVSRTEKVWNSVNLYSINYPAASGGGFSTYFRKPGYQKNAFENADMKNIPDKRGIPDLAGHADISPNSISYWIHVDGKSWLTGGTSAVAPLMAALISRLNEALNTQIGFFNTLLYEMERSNAIRPIVDGNNSMYGNEKIWPASKSWDACTGLGVPNGEAMLKFLQDKLRKKVSEATSAA